MSVRLDRLRTLRAVLLASQIGIEIVIQTTNLSSTTIARLDELAEIVRFHAPVVAFTGAGISTESGIPDYRGPQGLWTTGSQQPFTYQEFISNPEARLRWWQELPHRLEQVQAQQPNEGHRALVRLERAGILAWTITQNIDGLHRAAGTAANRLIELHGSSTTIRCTECGTVYDADEFLETHQQLDSPLPCPNCGGILKSGTIAFGQSLPPDDLRLAFAVARETGVMLVVGSTLLVNPAAQVPAYAKEHGAYLAILNNGETGLDELADFRLEAPAGAALTYLAERILTVA